MRSLWGKSRRFGLLEGDPWWKFIRAGWSFFIPLSFFIRVNHSRRPSTGFLLFFSLFVRIPLVRHRPCPCTRNRYARFLQRASVTLRLHLWFSFHNTRINHPSDGNFGRWASGLCDRFSLFLFFFFVFDYIK